MLTHFGNCKYCIVKNNSLTYKGKSKFYVKEIAGRKLSVQGYEGEALVYLVKRQYDINEFVIHEGRDTCPWFKYKFKDKTYKYFPDFYYKPKNLIIEVKSSWSLGLFNEEWFEKTRKKALRVIEKGYNFMLIVGGINNLPPFIMPPNWLTLSYKEICSWFLDCFGINKNRPHGKVSV